MKILISSLLVVICTTNLILIGQVTTQTTSGSGSSTRLSIDVTIISNWFNWLLYSVGQSLDAAGMDKAPIPNITQNLQQNLILGTLGGQISLYNGYVAGFAHLQATLTNITTDTNGDVLLKPDICLRNGTISTWATYTVNNLGPNFLIYGNYQDVCFQPTIRIYAIPLSQTTNMDDFTITSSGFIQSYTIQGLSQASEWIERPIMVFVAQQVKTAVENYLNQVVKVYFAQTEAGIPYPLNSIVAIPSLA